MKKIILASKSPRRKELLEKCGLPFACMPMETDESLEQGDTLEEKIRLLSERKACARLNVNPDAVVIGSDTIVTLDNEILGKPADREDAKRMLRELSGRTHRVITGVCITDKTTGQRDSFAVTTDVYFRDLTDEEILIYIDTSRPYDKAGAYGIQEGACIFVSRIDGDYYNVVGLPICEVNLRLKKFIMQNA